MHRRPDQMATYPGMYVFPGGRVEPGDWSVATLHWVRGLSAEQAQRLLQSNSAPDLCLGYWVAAIRELFEEAGIHFFVDDTGSGHGLQEETLALLSKRAALQEGRLGFADMLAAENLYCDLGRLAYFYHRVTPEHYATRFDTRFYLAALPAGQVALHVSEEVAESVWITPQSALLSHQAQGFPMMPPTLAVLRTLAQHASWKTLKEIYGIG